MIWIARITGVGLVLAMAAALTGCPFSTSPDDKAPPDPVQSFVPRTSVANLLENLKAAYDERVPAEYESLLARDFVFVFSDLDQTDPTVPSDDLTREDEVRIHESMFDATLVQTLTLRFHYDIQELEIDEEYTTENDTIWTLYVTNVYLYLYGGTPQHPNEPEGYELDGGVEQLWFRKNSWTHSNGSPIWTIMRWKEHNFGSGVAFAEVRPQP
jgi:hypothetical protein